MRRSVGWVRAARMFDFVRDRCSARNPTSCGGACVGLRADFATGSKVEHRGRANPTYNFAGEVIE